ncbi:hypothetical protein H6G11_15620 [Cyanobacterium aponinum FACHB-4101]|uniref:hypothetical protein n=1 Tax=Cyanobacterium aponinum TaxID=379064 RepID=UPI0016808F03|nr:hypothetical protein [Cyanobacterium aponinum]MBD2395673.1 hypothetical protein [Cyanobacterium aponinum FACHB-4101]
MTNQEKAKALKAYLRETAGFIPSSQWLKENIEHYEFIDGKVYHRLHLSESQLNSDQIEPNDQSSEQIDYEEYDPDKYTDWIEFEEECPPTVIKPEKKKDPYETYLLEQKWVLIYLTEDYQTTASRYKQAVGVWLYLKGKTSTPFFDNKEFIKQLYKELPHLQSILFSDVHWNKDPNKPYQEVTARMRWQKVYELLAKGKLRDLYEQWENPPVQLALALGV